MLILWFVFFFFAKGIRSIFYGGRTLRLAEIWPDKEKNYIFTPTLLGYIFFQCVPLKNSKHAKNHQNIFTRTNFTHFFPKMVPWHMRVCHHSNIMTYACMSTEHSTLLKGLSQNNPSGPSWTRTTSFKTGWELKTDSVLTNCPSLTFTTVAKISWPFLCLCVTCEIPWFFCKVALHEQCVANSLLVWTSGQGRVSTSNYWNYRKH